MVVKEELAKFGSKIKETYSDPVNIGLTAGGAVTSGLISIWIDKLLNDGWSWGFKYKALAIKPGKLQFPKPLDMIQIPYVYPTLDNKEFSWQIIPKIKGKPYDEFKRGVIAGAIGSGVMLIPAAILQQKIGRNTGRMFGYGIAMSFGAMVIRGAIQWGMASAKLGIVPGLPGKGVKGKALTPLQASKVTIPGITQSGGKIDITKFIVSGKGAYEIADNGQTIVLLKGRDAEVVLRGPMTLFHYRGGGKSLRKIEIPKGRREKYSSYKRDNFMRFYTATDNQSEDAPAAPPQTSSPLQPQVPSRPPPLSPLEKGIVTWPDVHPGGGVVDIRKYVSGITETVRAKGAKAGVSFPDAFQSIRVPVPKKGAINLKIAGPFIGYQYWLNEKGNRIDVTKFDIPAGKMQEFIIDINPYTRKIAANVWYVTAVDKQPAEIPGSVKPDVTPSGHVMPATPVQKASESLPDVKPGTIDIRKYVDKVDGPGVSYRDNNQTVWLPRGDKQKRVFIKGGPVGFRVWVWEEGKPKKLETIPAKSIRSWTSPKKYPRHIYIMASDTQPGAFVAGSMGRNEWSAGIVNGPVLHGQLGTGRINHATFPTKNPNVKILIMQSKHNGKWVHRIHRLEKRPRGEEVLTVISRPIATESTAIEVAKRMAMGNMPGPDDIEPMGKFRKLGKFGNQAYSKFWYMKNRNPKGQHVNTKQAEVLAVNSRNMPTLTLTKVIDGWALSAVTETGKWDTVFWSPQKYDVLDVANTFVNQINTKKSIGNEKEWYGPQEYPGWSVYDVQNIDPYLDINVPYGSPRIDGTTSRRGR